MDIAAIGDEDMILGFKLAGIQGKVFAEDTIEQSLESYKDVKVLVLTEQVAEYLREHKISTKAVIAEMPGKNGSNGAAMKNISRLLEEAIGVQLKGDS